MVRSNPSGLEMAALPNPIGNPARREELAPILSSTTFTDLEQHRLSMKGWDMQYTQMKPGRFIGITRGLRWPSLQFFLETSTVVLNCSGVGWPGSYMFGFPRQMEGTSTFNGQLWTPEDIVVAKGDREHNALLPPFNVMALAISCEALRDYMWTVEHVDMRGWLDHGPLIVRNPEMSRRVSAQLTASLEACFSDPSLATYPQTRSDIMQQVLGAVAPLVAVNQRPPRPTLSSFGHTQVVKRAREYILSHIDTPLQIIDVCRALRVSRRTLQYSFQEVLGINPASYLRVLRLNGARKDLINRGPDRLLQIKDVVPRWGFWHLSRFSAEYRQLFGELPSATLRSNAR
jgi:AraC family ethanolamine operon transcriptional activator